MKKKIAIYQTREYGFHLHNWELEAHMREQNLQDDSEIVAVTGKEIADGILDNEDFVGLVLPGRNKGQDYFDELTPVGSRNIQKAVWRGVAIKTVCAGTYYILAQTLWDNSCLCPGDRKRVVNPHPLIRGTARGPLVELWQDGYQGETQTASSSNTLLAKVVGITYTSELTGGKEENAYTLNWGGPEMISDSVDPTPHVVLAYYTPRQGVAPMAAAIEATHGRGKILSLSNHPEVSAIKFGWIFGNTRRARSDPSEFQADIRRMTEGEKGRRLLYQRFLGNCSYIGDKIRLNGQKPVEALVPAG